MRAVLIGGTSHTGKSTVAKAIAARLGFAYRPTDLLARHPGRPWRTPEREVPPHVAEHYGTLAVDELIRSVRDHYDRLWPRIEELIAEQVRGEGPGLVLEGSALWPGRVAGLTVPHTNSVWFTADDAVLSARVRRSARGEERRDLVDKFLARSLRFQQLMVESVDAHGLCRIDTSGRSVEELVAAVLSRPCRRQP
ncbi:hypothetical protein [Streptomyces sp. S.PB5]|uniref:hypothetical protein n=1 Tax=Streptomyces sp. S.PB5 TaxID=3020844 RepID=UPI0025B1160F|nr:hypothetical protein [Streptomyces sp. S.PB5]MDN3029135.1 hypothetical protein [Streptomyces sp. S.PB5]